MNWKKMGCIYCPGKNDKYQYAMFPNVQILNENEGKIRIYYTHRGSGNYGFPTYLDGLLNESGFRLLYNHNEPIIDRGALGTFDDSGVNITSIIKINGIRRFYYLAWNLGVTVPFRNSIGVAEEIDSTGTKLKRLYEGPILDRSKEYPYLCATPCVIKEKEGFYRLWYAAGEPWIEKEDNGLEVACNISYAESEDGIDWIRRGIVSVGHKPTDHVTTTPFVIKENNIFKMWYSYRGEKYRIGYAESLDGISYERKDELVGITVSESGWDSEMICYPQVFDLNGKRYMIYSGNSYGKTGIGLAILSY